MREAEGEVLVTRKVSKEDIAAFVGMKLDGGEVRVWLAKGTISMQYVTEDGLLTEYGREGGAMNVIVLEAPAKFSFSVVGETSRPPSGGAEERLTANREDRMGGDDVTVMIIMSP